MTEYPPIEWFRDPGLTEPTPITIEASGRIYGHVATWDSAHVGMPGRNVRPPRSRTDYSYFHSGGAVVSDAGQPVDISVGKLTLDTGHASLSADAGQAASHYDDTGTIVATVCAGEDQHGIWYSGAVSPGLDDLRMHRLRASAISGDWRPINNSLELVAALCVNSGGFPIPRARVASAADVVPLVAAGMVAPDPVAASTWDEAAHPRGTGDVGGQWVAKNEGGKAAQKDKRSQELYSKLEDASPDAAKAMLKGLGDDELRKLTEFAYSSKTSDPRIVAARNRVASEMGRRGIDIKKHGAAGGGAKAATRASAVRESLVSAPTPPVPHDGPSPDGTVSIGDTGLVGRVIESTDSGDVVVEVTVSADMVHAASDQEAMAASAKLTERQQLRSLSASVESLRADLAARDRSDAAARLLEGVPAGQ